jgi:hypothetical protein
MTTSEQLTLIDGRSYSESRRAPYLSFWSSRGLASDFRSASQVSRRPPHFGMFSGPLTADFHSCKVVTYPYDVQNNQQATYACLQSGNAGASCEILGDLEDRLQTAGGGGTGAFHTLRVLGAGRKLGFELGFDGGYHDCRDWIAGGRIDSSHPKRQLVVSVQRNLLEQQNEYTSSKSGVKRIVMRNQHGFCTRYTAVSKSYVDRQYALYSARPHRNLKLFPTAAAPTFKR